MNLSKIISKIEVIDPGSPPDVDSDFNTQVRDLAVEHVEELYGNVANIVTFTTMKAKGAFKAACTIFEIPFASANKMANLIPQPIDGVEMTLEEIFDEDHPRYPEGSEFRTATSGSEWEEILEAAKALSGRISATGVHPCGVVISQKPLQEVIPYHVSRKDQKIITQWKYNELEEIGLLKMDFLGLDTVDLIQHTVENILESDKKVPNMVDIINGPMDDRKTYEMISRGETVGTFQLAGAGVQDLLKRMKPDRVEDIFATTALYRPGPMGMNSHIKYADRKNGLEEIDFIHPEFKGSAMEEILKDTYGILVYQEQVMQIANQIAGMTLQEGDDFRRAMGKKKKSVMDKMRPKFFEGALRNGFSEGAIQTLWDTIEFFAKYGFNYSHSVAYGINAYQTAYLKANYPVEFFSSLIEQNSRNKDKIFNFLREASRIGLKIGAVDAQLSKVKVSPNYDEKIDADVLYGISAVSSVSKEMAESIVRERETNGKFESATDFVRRSFNAGVTNITVFKKLAQGGAFDTFNVSRKGVVEALPELMKSVKTSAKKGDSLFESFGGEQELESISVKIGEEEYPHVEKLALESSVIGHYVSGHPLENIGQGLNEIHNYRKIGDLIRNKKKGRFTVVGFVAGIERKKSKGKIANINLTVDDGTEFLEARLSPDIAKGIAKGNALNEISSIFKKGDSKISPELKKVAFAEGIKTHENIVNDVYIMTVDFRPSFDGGNYFASVKDLRRVKLSNSGELPIRIRVQDGKNFKKFSNGLPKKMSESRKGNVPILVGRVDWDNLKVKERNEDLYREAVRIIESGNGEESEERQWPIKGFAEYRYYDAETEEQKIEALKQIEYEDSGFTSRKDQRLFQTIEKYLGSEGIDSGVCDFEEILRNE